MELTLSEQQEEKNMKKCENSLRHLQGNIKQTNIHIIGVLAGEDREKGAYILFEKIMA